MATKSLRQALLVFPRPHSSLGDRASIHFPFNFKPPIWHLHKATSSLIRCININVHLSPNQSKHTITRRYRGRRPQQPYLTLFSLILNLQTEEEQASRPLNPLPRSAQLNSKKTQLFTKFFRLIQFPSFPTPINPPPLPPSGSVESALGLLPAFALPFADSIFSFSFFFSLSRIRPVSTFSRIFRNRVLSVPALPLRTFSGGPAPSPSGTDDCIVMARPSSRSHGASSCRPPRELPGAGGGGEASPGRVAGTKGRLKNAVVGGPTGVPGSVFVPGWAGGGEGGGLVERKSTRAVDEAGLR